MGASRSRNLFAEPKSGATNTQVAKVEAKMIVTRLREILTVRDVALELRCSVAHVYNVISGKVKNVSRLPAISIGRRKLIQRDSLEEWKKTNEQSEADVVIAPSKIGAVRRMDEDSYA